MPGGLQNEPTTASRVLVTRQRFEEDIQRGDKPPWYLIPERYEARHGRQWAYYDLPYGAGRCKVSWETGQFNFEWS